MGPMEQWAYDEQMREGGADEHDGAIDDWEQPPCQQCGAMTSEEAATKCLGAAAGDDCHGNHLWQT